MSVFRKIYINSFFRFSVVGSAGMLSNITVFYLSSHVIGLWLNISSIIAFLFAVSQNYYFNHTWSFKLRLNSRPTLKSYYKYILVNLAGLVINLLALNILVGIKLQAITAQVIGVCLGLAANYAGAYLYVFANKAKTIQ